MKYFLYHMDKIWTSVSVLKNFGENSIFSPSRQIYAMSDKRKPVNQECVKCSLVYSIPNLSFMSHMAGIISLSAGKTFLTLAQIILRAGGQRSGKRSPNLLHVICKLHQS